MKGLKMNTANIAKATRQFARATFGARICKVEGEFQSTVRGNVARLMIQNPDRVLENLRAQCGRPVEDTEKVKKFKFGKKGFVELVLGNTTVLKIISV